MNPATAFDRYARLVLHTAGQPHTATALARLLRVSPSQWYAWTSGQKDPGARTMAQWLVRWEEAGRLPVEIVLTAEGARVVPSSNAVAETGMTRDEARALAIETNWSHALDRLLEEHAAAVKRLRFIIDNGLGPEDFDDDPPRPWGNG